MPSAALAQKHPELLFSRAVAQLQLAPSDLLGGTVVLDGDPWMGGRGEMGSVAMHVPTSRMFCSALLPVLVLAIVLTSLPEVASETLLRTLSAAVLTGLTLLGCFLFARWLVTSKYGRVLQAIRDAESRVMFSGYSPLPYKLSIWVISAVMCGVAGALYVPQVGIINPGEMSAANSIEIAVWAAVGGRATLIGPIVGAFLVNGAKSWLTVTAPEFWLYFLGALFIAVTLYLPNGVVGLIAKLQRKGGAA